MVNEWDKPRGDFVGETRDIIFRARSQAEYAGRDILMHVQTYLAYGKKCLGSSAVDRFLSEQVESGLDKERGDFVGRTREIILQARREAVYGGRDILIGAQMYLMYGSRGACISSVDRFFVHTVPEVRERELRESYGGGRAA